MLKANEDINVCQFVFLQVTLKATRCNIQTQIQLLQLIIFQFLKFSLCQNSFITFYTFLHFSFLPACSF